MANATQSVKQTLKTLDMVIRFGTSGWRAVIADEFTFAGGRRVTGTSCTHFGAPSDGGLMIVGRDTRFLGGRFAAECAEVVAGNGFRALSCDEPTTTPVISHAIRSQNTVCGINFTASHNPPEYNGMKHSTGDWFETPVGFNLSGELINEDKIILGGKESAGPSIKSHYPEKDGILACLLAAEAVAARGPSLSEQLNALYERVGKVESGRIGVR